MTQEAREAGRTYSGKVNLRMPKTLHRDLARRAGEEGVSLNQFMVVALVARAVGEELPDSSEKEPDA
jgi:predicted HicB family RNase H-like nuclease